MHWLILMLAGLGLAVIVPSTLPAQAMDSSSTSLSGLLAELSPSTRLRVSSGGARWSGRLAAGHRDSLTVGGASGTRTIPLSTVDTLWVQRKSHSGLAAGAGFGALMFGLLHLGSGGDHATANQLGTILFLGATGAGLLIDATSARWSRRYPE